MAKTLKDYCITTISSHSALQILKGAKQEGFRTLLIVKPDRQPFYDQFNFIDETIVIDDFSKFPKAEKELIKRNAIIVPHGSFVAYLGLEQNKKMKAHYFGNKKVLDWESDRKLQHKWLDAAGISTPKIFKKKDKITHASIVKTFGAEGGSGYFIVKDQKDFDEKIKDFKTDKQFLVQEYIIGVTIYIHYFYSPLTDKLEIMSIDRRYETNVDSIGRIPLKYQDNITIEPSFVVVGNQPVVLRESLLPRAYDMGMNIVKTSQKMINKKGIVGSFCLETVVTEKQEFVALEISARIVAGTNLFMSGSPYTDLNYDEPMSTGRRIAREIKTAIELDELNLILD